MNGVFVHPSTIVETRRVGAGTRIWAFSHVMKDASIGSNCNIGEHCFVESHVSVGNNVTLKNGNMLWEGVVLEDGVFIGPTVFFSNDRHPRSRRLPQAYRRYQGRGWMLPTVVKRGASIGAGAIVNPGVTIGEFSLIGPGTHVIRDVPPYAYVAGSPARRRGWVCQCGGQLRFAGTSAHCAECGMDYERKGATVALKTRPHSRPTRLTARYLPSV